MEDKDFKKFISINTIMSIPLLSIDFYEGIFFTIYSFIEIALLVYKNSKYPLPGYAISIEAIILVLFILIQVIRHSLIKRGILDKQPGQVLLYLALTILVIPLYVFELRLQTYVLLIEVVINWIGIGFNILEFFLAIWVWRVFDRRKNIS